MGKYVLNRENQYEGGDEDCYRVRKYAPPEPAASSLEASNVSVCERHAYMYVAVIALGEGGEEGVACVQHHEA